MPLSVLLVEDSASVRDVCRLVLERRDYAVFLAADAVEFAAATEAVSGVDLLITDCELPGIHGTEVASTVRGLWPDARVIFMTGSTGAQGLTAEDALLLKPFTPTELLDCIDQVLAS